MKKTLPEFIYKYTSINKYLFESLIRGELWFSSPSDFNDPFDSSLPIDFLIESYKRTEGWETNRDLIVNEQARIVQPLNFSAKLEELRKKVGVCCFSSVNDNLIMWSHYANHHKGLLLKFDVAELGKHFNQIERVAYTDKICPVDYDSPPEKLLTTLLTKKSTHWKTEKEIRIVVENKGNYRFPPIALKEIKFGLRCDNHQQTDIIQLIKKFGYKDTNFTAVHIGNYTYKFNTAFITTESGYKMYRKFGDKKILIPGFDIEI